MNSRDFDRVCLFYLSGLNDPSAAQWLTWSDAAPPQMPAIDPSALIDHRPASNLPLAPQPVQAATIFIDFANNQIRRAGLPDSELGPTLPVRILEQFFRGHAMSVSRLALLNRVKHKHAVRSKRHDPAKPLRHEINALRKLIDARALGIEVRAVRGIYRATFDASSVSTNIGQALRLVLQAGACLQRSDNRSALPLLESALASDPDCLQAAALVVRMIHSQSPVTMAQPLVVRAEVCIARAMIGYVAAIHRFGGHNCAAEDLPFQRLAERLLKRLQPKWDALQSWPKLFSPAQSPSDDHRSALRAFVNVALGTRYGNDPAAHARFGQHPAVARILGRLHTGAGDLPRGRQIQATLAAVVICRLFLNLWLPAPALSLAEFENSIVEFLRRRIDWQDVLDRTASLTVQFRDDLSRDAANRNGASEDSSDQDSDP